MHQSLLGYYDDDGKLIYAGRVGTGMPAKVLADLQRRLTYRSASGPIEVDFQFEELEELHWRVERGPDWNMIESIVVKLNPERTTYPDDTVEAAAELFQPARRRHHGLSVSRSARPRHSSRSRLRSSKVRRSSSWLVLTSPRSA